MDDESGESTKQCPIVAFGASAGGLEAFAEVLKHLDTDLGAAIVLILHLSPEHESMVSELLPRWTLIPVSVAAETWAGLHDSAAGVDVDERVIAWSDSRRAA